MKRFYFISLRVALAVVAIISFSRCKVDEGGIYGSFPYLNVNITDTTITKSSQEFAIVVESNRNVKVSVDRLWLDARISGSQLVIKAQQNELEEERSATITLTTPNESVTHKILVRQDASGELTYKGDLLLKSHSEVLLNTYTKAEGNLFLGNLTFNIAVAQNVAAPAAESVTVRFGDSIVVAQPSDISDLSIKSLNEIIHSIGKGSIVAVNTKITSVPFDLVSANSVKRLYLDYNEIASLPSAEQIAELGLTELSISNNKLSDISSLQNAQTIEYLNLANNLITEISPLSELGSLNYLILDNNSELYNIEPLLSIPSLQKVSLRGLPITKTQVDVLMEKVEGEKFEIDTTSIIPNNSPLPKLECIETLPISESSFTIRAKVISQGASAITRYGFYVGDSKDIKSMKFVEATFKSYDNIMSATIEDTPIENHLTFFRACAQNEEGEGFSDLAYYGEVDSQGDVLISNESELKDFEGSRISNIKGSIFVGKNLQDGTSVDAIELTVDGNKYWFNPWNLSSINSLETINKIDKGIYVGNTNISDFTILEKLESVESVWLKKNAISKVPNLSNVANLKSLNVSENQISDIAPILSLTNLEELYLGDENRALEETNNIGVLDELEQMTNLKVLDLSGLPIHSYQVDSIKKKLSSTNVKFRPGSRRPLLPTVVSESAMVNGTSIALTGLLSDRGNSDVVECGFYYGINPNNLIKVKSEEGINQENRFSQTITVETITDDTYYYYPYAINSLGEAHASEFSKFKLVKENLSQVETANSYIVNNGGSYYFDASIIGNGDRGIIPDAGFHTNTSVIAPVSANVVWEEKEGMISGVTYNAENKSIEFSTSGEKGNALIAAKDENGIILWSWHIWVTDVPKEHIYTTYEGTQIEVMDRNLGAIRADKGTGDQWKESVGMAYQWGRKDPLSVEHTTMAGQTTYTILESIQQPNTATSSEVDYWVSPLNDKLWGGKKTIYDPCPAGYMVAPPDTWTGFSPTGGDASLDQAKKEGGWNNGLNLKYSETGIAWYPANFDVYSSTIVLTKYNGTYFSHAPYSEGSSYARSFFMSEGQIRPISPSKQSAFGAIRCVKDKEYIIKLAPEVNTLAVSSITANSAKVSGEIVSSEDIPVTDKGFVWSETPGATINSSDKISLGSGRGTFSAEIQSLQSFTTYYVRAYATNEYGTVYGEDIEFRTEYSGDIIYLSDEGTANCYIVEPDKQRYSFDAGTIGNGAIGIIEGGNFHTTSPSISPVSVKVLWEQSVNPATYEYDYSTQVIGLVELDSSTKRVSFVTSGVKGNALIAVTDASDEILWSWHIWVTDRPSDQELENYIKKGFTIMDRNLGALIAERGSGSTTAESAGLLYQWGRKDPAADGQYVAAQQNEQYTLSRAIQNPTTFPMFGISSWTRYSYSKLWERTKTIYDPCPYGYRVSQSDVWSGFSTTGEGVYYDESRINIEGIWQNGYYFVINEDGDKSWFPAMYNRENGKIWSTDKNTQNDAFSNLLFRQGSVEYHYSENWDLRNIRCIRDVEYTDPIPAEVTAPVVAEAQKESVLLSATVTSEGSSPVTERGMVWSTKRIYTPNLLDLEYGGYFQEKLGSGSGDFTLTINDLYPSTTYWVYSYAISRHGVVYSDVVAFNTNHEGGIQDVNKGDEYSW